MNDETDSEVEPAHLIHNERTGILSVVYDDVEGALCDDGFTQEDAEVACFELYEDSEVESFTGGHECDYRTFWLDNVECTGDEETIASCVHLAYGVHNCNWERECVELFCGGGGPGRPVPVSPIDVPSPVPIEAGHTTIN